MTGFNIRTIRRYDPTPLWIILAIGSILIATAVNTIRHRTSRPETIPHHLAARGSILLGR